MPEISIIVPVYKVEQYLDRCVNSILNQTFTDFELILVDDGSPDRCPQMCEEWAKKDSRIKVIHKKNGGLSSARNAALKIFLGEYVIFVDSDDWLEKDAIEILYKNLKDTESDISIGAFVRAKSQNILTNNPDNIIEVYSRDEYLDMFLKFTSQETRYYAWAKLYTKTVAKEIEYPEGYTSEDIQGTFFALVHSKRIVQTKRVVYNYFVNNDSITQKALSKTHVDMFQVWKNVIDYAVIYAPQYVSKCHYNYCRISIGALLTYLYRPISNKYLDYKIDIKNIKNILNKNYILLLKGPLPAAKKIVLTVVRYMPEKVFEILAEKQYRKSNIL